MALPQRITAPDTAPAPIVVARIRRCTYRRLGRVAANGTIRLDVNCLYPDRRIPLPLGDMESSRPICEACVATGVFRPDED
jgi:hypothetical protein